MAFGDASTLQINVTSVNSGAPTSCWVEELKLRINWIKKKILPDLEPISNDNENEKEEKVNED